MREQLEEEGVLVTYYTHTSPEAWSNLLEYYAYVHPRSRFVEKLEELDEALVEKAIT
ncbi:MAG: hypothetical protein N2V78_10290 [Methanophagales archaeon]|nr:hypothetical protein [Methanophagales archaeon]